MSARAWITGVLAAALFAGAALWFVRPERSSNEGGAVIEERGTGQRGSSPESAARTEAPVASISNPRQAAVAGEVPAPAPTGPVVASVGVVDAEVGIVDWRDRIGREIWRASPADIEDRRRRAEAREPESAFWLSEFLRLCLTVPRTERGQERHLSRINERLEVALRRQPDGDHSWAEDALEQSYNAFQNCAEIGPDEEPDLASLEWLELAADLGHQGAQRLYHAHAHELLLGTIRPNGRQLAFIYPDLIGEFRLRADRYARALLDSGSPQALTLMARMMAFGDVYQRDLVKAYAYAVAARLEGSAGLQHAATAWMDQLGEQLTTDEIAAAEDLAVELLP